MISLDSLEILQARNRILFDEMGQEAQRFLSLLAAWKTSSDEDLRAELEAQVITLRIHAQALEKSLEEETELLPEDEQ
jgi:hypothetical protein